LKHSFEVRSLGSAECSVPHCFPVLSFIKGIPAGAVPESLSHTHRERERKRERERQRDRHIDRQTDRERERETGSQRVRETDRSREKERPDRDRTHVVLCRPQDERHGGVQEGRG